MTEQFFIRHQTDYLQKRFLLVFKSDQARDFFKQAIPGSSFEEIPREKAAYIMRAGLGGEMIPYGYTHLLTEEEMNRLSVDQFDQAAALLAEGNQRLYEQAIKEKKNGNKDK